MRALVLYNPKSGTQKISKNIELVKKELTEAGYEVDFFPSPAPRSITTKVMEDGNNYDLLVTSGGDGTLNETVSGMMMGNVTTKLAYIPAGTVNDVGKILKLKKNVKKGLKIAKTGVPVKMDIIKLNDKYACYVFAAGKFTAISYDIDYKFKKKFGKLAYFLRGAKELPKKAGMRIRLTLPDETTYSNSYVFFGFNWQQFGGFKIYRKNPPLLNDGLIDISLIEKTRRWSWLRALRFVFRGDRLNKKRDGVRTYSASKFTIESDAPIDYNADGEFAFTTKKCEVEVLHQALTIIVPEKSYKKYFDNKHSKENRDGE